MSTIKTFQIQGMHCQSCVAKVSQALSPFAERVEVTLQPPQAILHDSKSNLKTLQNALSQVGKYQISIASPLASPTSSEVTSVFLMTITPRLGP